MHTYIQTFIYKYVPLVRDMGVVTAPATDRKSGKLKIMQMVVFWYFNQSNIDSASK